MAGWDSLGSALAGGGGAQMAYNRGALTGADLQYKLAEARKAVQEGLSREALAAQLERGGDGELAGALRAGIDPREIGGYRKEQQGVRFGDQAWANATGPAPDLELLNRMNIVREGKPVDLTKIEGGVAFSPQLLPGSQTIAPTAVGQSEIAHRLAAAGAEQALAGERNAHAGLYNAQTAAGGFAPSGGLTGRGATGTASIADALAGPDPTQPTGPEAMARVDPAMRPIVQAVIDGRYPVPTGRAATSPEWMAVVQAATQVDPQFDAAGYPARAATRKDLTGGGQGANQIQALNTLAGHLQEAWDTSNDLGNRWSPLWNSLANAYETGTGSDRVTNFNRAANTVGSEFAKVLKGGVPSVAEIQEQRHLLDPNMSPDQLHGSLRTMASQVEARLAALQERANQGLGAGAASVQVISPQARAVFDRISGGHGAPPGAAPAPSATSKVVNGKTYVNVNGQWYEQ